MKNFHRANHVIMYDLIHCTHCIIQLINMAARFQQKVLMLLFGEVAGLKKIFPKPIISTPISLRGEEDGR